MLFSNKGIRSFNNLVINDIRVAINDYGQSVGGWGGSFYFWNEQFDTSSTVGQLISSDKAELRKFRRTTVAGVTAVYLKHGRGAAGDVLNTLKNSDTYFAGYHLFPRPEANTPLPQGF